MRSLFKSLPDDFCLLDDLLEDEALLDAARACIDAQRRAGSLDTFESAPQAEAQAAVSVEALERTLESGTDVHGISREDEISNVVTFNAPHIENAVVDADIARKRAALDAIVGERLDRHLNLGVRHRIANSGHFWYPNTSYMGWHTNNKAPGWRVYLTHAAEPGRSFFRYRDPDSGDIVTSHDRLWDVRMFRVNPNQSFWHCVYSETDRFSFGYLIYAGGPLYTLRRGFKRLLTK